MKKIFAIPSLVLFVFSCNVVLAQSVAPDSTSRARTVTNQQQPATGNNDAPVKTVKAEERVENSDETETIVARVGPEGAKLTPSMIRSRIAEAERFFKSKPMPTALTVPSIEFVTLAALDQRTGRIHLLTVTKEIFLTKGAEANLTTTLGTPVTLRVVRANGVNTAVTVFDLNGHSLTPLTVEFPIEKRGLFREMAYYTSAHPALLSPDLVRSGQSYVRSMVDLAAKRLRERGMIISPQIVDVAERLCLVEHVDHDRFKRESRPALFNEIYSLYALNETDTYRFSVSTAGAGGMVQMIPWAYNLIRQRHPAAQLIPDFVTGMRNHGNALQAMLLYMQDTWNDLSANADVQYALSTQQATQTELLAAGYNSNAAKLPGYLRRGGSGWRVLIPRETQMYLQIYKNFEALVPIKSRSTSDNSKAVD